MMNRCHTDSSYDFTHAFKMKGFFMVDCTYYSNV